MASWTLPATMPGMSLGTAMPSLYRITPAGVATLVYTFAPGSFQAGVAVDISGNYVVTEQAGALSMITPGGVRTVIYDYTTHGLGGATPFGVAIILIPQGPVGGLVMPVNKLEILTPYLILTGLVAAVSTVVLVKKRR